MFVGKAVQDDAVVESERKSAWMSLDSWVQTPQSICGQTWVTWIWFGQSCWASEVLWVMQCLSWCAVTNLSLLHVNQQSLIQCCNVTCENHIICALKNYSSFNFIAKNQRKLVYMCPAISWICYWAYDAIYKLFALFMVAHSLFWLMKKEALCFMLRVMTLVQNGLSCLVVCVSLNLKEENPAACR